MNDTIKPIVLIDGSSYLYRAFHAMPPLTNSKGVPTGAVYGVLNMIRKLITDVEPEYIAVVFDPKGKTFRSDLYPEYKAHRPPMPDELRVQIQPLHDAVRAMGLPMLVVDGFEADDVIGTLTVHAKQAGVPVLISTGDKDMAQLVNGQVKLINTMNNVTMDTAGVEEKFGVLPDRIIDYLTLIGDTSDNVPGVPKVGPKTAVKWLKEYGSLDEIMAQADAIKGKIGENLRASLEQLPLSKELVTIVTDVPLPLEFTDLKLMPPDSKKLIELYAELEFKTWLSNMMQDDVEHQVTHTDYQTIFTEQEFESVLKRLEDCKVFAFDTETTSLVSHDAKIVGVSIAFAEGDAVYIPVAHDYLGAPEQLNREHVLEKLSVYLNDPNKTVIGQNLKYDIGVLENYGITINAKIIDTMLESYVLNSTSNRHDMDTLALLYLGKKTIKFEEIAGKGKKQLTFNDIAIEVASDYAAEDADVTLQLHQTLWPRIEKEDNCENILLDVELPLMRVLSKMQRTGVLIDAKKLQTQSGEFAKRIGDIEKQVHGLAGQEFNLASPKQLREILFEKMQLPVVKKTPTGQPSTSEPILQELAIDYELPKLILEHRSLSKLKSTYTDKLPLQINAHTGRVHTSYNQAVTATGRLSSTDPNLQNIPVRKEEGRRIRQAFIAAPGCKFLSADYSQIELRIMAHLSQDPGLLKAFSEGIDVHRATAAEVFNVPLDQVSDDQRRSSKAINFGLIYGMSAFGLAKQLGVSRRVAQEYMDVYFARYPGIKTYMEQTRLFAHEHGYVETLMGRRLNLADINSKDKMAQMAAERAAINAPMQGTAADLIKLAMITIDQWLATRQLKTKMIMQVHDELIFEIPEEELEEVKAKVKQQMESAMQLSVPLIVDVGVGDNWDEAH